VSRVRCTRAGSGWTQQPYRQWLTTGLADCWSWISATGAATGTPVSSQSYMAACSALHPKDSSSIDTFEAGFHMLHCHQKTKRHWLKPCADTKRTRSGLSKPAAHRVG
jgi:hypothetical protein